MPARCRRAPPLPRANFCPRLAKPCDISESVDPPPKLSMMSFLPSVSTCPVSVAEDPGSRVMVEFQLSPSTVTVICSLDQVPSSPSSPHAASPVRHRAARPAAASVRLMVSFSFRPPGAPAGRRCPPGASRCAVGVVRGATMAYGTWNRTGAGLSRGAGSAPRVQRCAGCGPEGDDAALPRAGAVVRRSVVGGLTCGYVRGFPGCPGGPTRRASGSPRVRSGRGGRASGSPRGGPTLRASPGPPAPTRWRRRSARALRRRPGRGPPASRRRSR